MVPERQRPHPGRAYRRRVHLEDAADNRAILEHVEIVLAPFARGARCRRALEDQLRGQTRASFKGFPESEAARVGLGLGRIA